MQARRMKVEGAVEFTPRGYPDDRGFFVSPFQESALIEAVGHPLFPVAQASCSLSRRGVVRGLHFTATPPGMAKYVYCSGGKALDIVLDVREGSPTFGQWDAVTFQWPDFRAVYFPVGVAHMFVVLEDDTTMSYLLSREYVAENELALSAVDPALGLPMPADIEPILSERDLAAPTLADLRGSGLLPAYHECVEFEAEFGVRHP